MESDSLLPDPRSSWNGNSDANPQSCWAKFKNAVRNITVEPVLFLGMFAISLQSVTVQNLTLQKICLITYRYPDYICSNMSANKTIQSQVQSLESNYAMYREYLTIIPSLILGLIIGAWSDKNGRKIPIIVGKMGMMLSSGSYLLNSIFFNLRPEYLLISNVLVGCTGGSIAFAAAVESLIADQSSSKTRTMRFGYMDASKFIAFPFGILASGHIKEAWGFVPIFALSTGIYIVSLIYLVLRLRSLPIANPSSRQSQVQAGREGRTFFQSVIKLDYFRDSINMCLKRRSGHKRAYILLILLANWLMSIPGFGEGISHFLYFQFQFDWNQLTYSYYAALGTTLVVISLVLLVPLLTQKMKLSDPALQLIGNFARFINPILVAFSTQPWMVWSASSLLLFYPFSFPAMRSLLSKLVSPDEKGKVYTIKEMSETAIPLFAATIYAQLYRATIDTFPGAFLLMSACFMLIPGIIFIFIYFDTKRNDPIGDLEEEQPVVDTKPQST